MIGVLIKAELEGDEAKMSWIIASTIRQANSLFPIAHHDFMYKTGGIPL